ncbi:hypothetical protein F5X97DRAFT_92494 [Nemania serpens]|nr:hypothetical protein F5X97DRAFT_92494 [Nemania serpens]
MGKSRDGSVGHPTSQAHDFAGADITGSITFKGYTHRVSRFSMRPVNKSNLLQRQDQTKDPDAIMKYIDDIPQNDPSQMGRLNNLVSRIFKIYVDNPPNDTCYLDKAIARAEETVQHATWAEKSGSPAFGNHLHNLGNAMSVRYDRTSNAEDLEGAISHIEKAIEVAEKDSPELARRLSDLSGIQLKQYYRTGDTNYMDNAILSARKAIEKSPRDSPGQKSLSATLSAALSQRYRTTWQEEVWDEALSLACEALSLAPEQKLDADTAPSNDAEDGSASTSTRQDQIPQDDREQARRLGNLSSLLFSWYWRWGNITDLNNAISRTSEAIKFTAQDLPGCQNSRSDLGTMFLYKYAHTGKREYLDKAISEARGSVEATPHLDPDRAHRLNKLSDILFQQYQVEPNKDLLEEAISAKRTAVEALPDSHPDHAGHLNQLSMMLLKQYESTSDIEHLKEAISEARTALDATPSSHPGLAGRLTRLSYMLHKQYKLTSDEEHLKEAILRARKGVDATPSSYPGLGSRLSRLSYMLYQQYNATPELSHLQAAISEARKAVQATPDTRPDLRAAVNSQDSNTLHSPKQPPTRVSRTINPASFLPIRLRDLSHILLELYEHSKNAADLEEAISTARAMVSKTPIHDRDLGNRMDHLVKMLLMRHDDEGRDEDREEAEALTSRRQNLGKECNGDA